MPSIVFFLLAPLPQGNQPWRRPHSGGRRAHADCFPAAVDAAYVRKLMRGELELVSQTTAASEETLGNAKIVKAFTCEDYEIGRYKTLAWQQFAVTRKRVQATGAIGAFTTLLGVSGVAAFLWYGGTTVLNV